MRRKPFLEDGLLPFVKRYLIHTRGDVIPERLNVSAQRPASAAAAPIIPPAAVGSKQAVLELVAGGDLYPFRCGAVSW